MKPNLLILSGAYSSAEIAAEFGNVPPAFLPISNRPLFELQADGLKEHVGSIFLTVPTGFQMMPADEQQLADRQITVVRTAPDLSLGQATLVALSNLPDSESLVILFGDTLIEHEGSTAPDHFVVSKTNDYFQWADVSWKNQGLRLQMGYKSCGQNRKVACGLFSFSSTELFTCALKETGDFLTAVETYSMKRKLSEISVDEWYDFGHLPLLYRSRRDMLISRTFNNMACDGVMVTKSSRDRDKLRAEAEWYKKVPRQIRVFLPQFLGFDQDEEVVSYSCEYLYLPTLSELAVFGRLPRYVWRQILNGCLAFLSVCREIPDETRVQLWNEGLHETFFDQIIEEKSRSRFHTFLESRNWQGTKTIEVNGEQSPPLQDILETCINLVPKTGSQHLAFSHGDFFFGNSFFDFRAMRVKLIDPRGCIDPQKPTLYGDYRYDVAKLAHSVIGGYDVLLANRAGFIQLAPDRFHLPEDFLSNQKELIELFKELLLDGQPVMSREIMALTCLLFLSMLPLHAEQESRQNAFLANAVRLFRMIDGEKA